MRPLTDEDKQITGDEMLALACYLDDAEPFLKDDFARKKLLKQWTHTCKAFGVFHLIIIGDRGCVPILGDSELVLEIFESYAAVRDKYKQQQFVVITEHGQDLDSFKHPENCIYVVGSNYADPAVRNGDLTVGIRTAPLVGHTDIYFPLHDIAAATIILQHRFN